MTSNSNLNGQDKKSNYGKASDEIFPFQRFQKAYKYNFKTKQKLKEDTIHLHMKKSDYKYLPYDGKEEGYWIENESLNGMRLGCGFQDPDELHQPIRVGSPHR